MAQKLQVDRDGRGKLTECNGIESFYDGKSDSVFTGSLGCLAPQPLEVSSEMFRCNQTVTVILGGYCNQDSDDRRFLIPVEKHPMPVWTMFKVSRNSYVYTVKHISPGPLARKHTGYTACLLNATTAVIHGGTAKHPWCFSISRNYWTNFSQPFSNNRPPLTSHHIAAKFNKTTILIYGGLIESGAYGNKYKAYNGVWLLKFHNLHTCSGEWINMTHRIQGGQLPPRYYLSATVFQSYIVIYGGVDEYNLEEVYTSRYDQSITVIDTTQTGPNLIIQQLPLSPPIPVRYAHSLSIYTSAGLLLLGGVESKSDKTANAAMILQMADVIEKNGKTVTAIPFFHTAQITFHHVIRHFVFCLESKPVPRTFLWLKNTNQCPPGYQRTNHSKTCQQCPQNYVSPTTHSQCIPCPNPTITNGTGQTQCISPDPCRPGYCHGHGHCVVSQDFKPICQCQYGYLPSDNCKFPTVHIAVLTGIILTALLFISATALYKCVYHKNDAQRKDQQLQDKHRELRVRQKKLDQINAGTRIKWTDLTIIKQLASGRYSKVYLAQFGEITVAVKRFPAYFTPSSPYDAFIQEAETLRSLRHPNIVAFFGAGRDPTSKRPFLVMEYLTRGSLYQVLHDHSNVLDHPDRLRFAKDIANGVAYLHSSSPPRIHRDLKSCNLLVSDKWVVKVGDFKTARFIVTRQQPEEEQQPQNQQHSTHHEEALLESSFSERQSHSSHSLLTPLLTDASTNHGETYQRYRTRGVMTYGVGTSRWKAPESLEENDYSQKTDVYRYMYVIRGGGGG